MDWSKIDFKTIPSRARYESTEILDDVLLNETIKNGLSRYFSNYVGQSTDVKKLIAELPIKNRVIHKAISDEGSFDIMLTANGHISINYTNKHNSDIRIALTTLSEEELTVLTKYFNDNLAKQSSHGSIYMIQKGTGFSKELTLTGIGTVGSDLIRDNYNGRIIEDFDHVVADLQAKEPCGRLVILSGPPGTGKTYFIRGLIQAVPDSMFILFTTDLISKITMPDVLDILMENRKKSLVLIMEDADDALVPRGMDNQAYITNILNATDGLLGTSLNLRIIASTNARHEEIDPAILRSGRTCRRISIDKLTPERANKLVAKMSNRPGQFTSPVVLADVYAAGNNNKIQETGITPEVGFSPERSPVLTKELETVLSHSAVDLEKLFNS